MNNKHAWNVKETRCNRIEQVMKLHLVIVDTCLIVLLVVITSAVEKELN